MRTIALLTAILACQAMAPAQNTLLTSTQEMHRVQQDPKAYIARLEDPARDAYQKPAEVVKALKIKQGEAIADIRLAALTDAKAALVAVRSSAGKKTKTAFISLARVSTSEKLPTVLAVETPGSLLAPESPPSCRNFVISSSM